MLNPLKAFKLYSRLSDAQENLSREFGVDIRDTPNYEGIRDVFSKFVFESSTKWSPEALTSLAYRLVVLGHLLGAKERKETTGLVDFKKISELKQIQNRAVDWSEKADDGMVLEYMTSDINQDIETFFREVGD